MVKDVQSKKQRETKTAFIFYTIIKRSLIVSTGISIAGLQRELPTD